MHEREVKLILGGLLHDIGKVIYRTGDGKKHSESGYEYLSDKLNLKDADITESVRYHHGASLRKAKISDNSFAYITYIADNIASAADRREEVDGEFGFEMSAPLEPVFNRLNGNKEKKYYHPTMLLADQINYPTENKINFGKEFYDQVMERITDCLYSVEWKEEYINSILSVLEATLSYVPSSTSKAEVADISLYDHMKLTAAMNSCIYEYLKENNISDYKKELLTNEKEFMEKKAFLLYSMDISGIQKFIYTIHSEKALKTLRARSFYLQMVMEHIMDDLLQKLGLSRANIIYAGGGHCYILLPNTQKTKDILEEQEQVINRWLREKYDIALYVATGYAEASANTFKNVPEGSYAQMYRTVSNEISEKKANRYTAEQIMELNHREFPSYHRECKICKRLDVEDKDEDLCDTCSQLIELSKAILSKPFFTIVREDAKCEDSKVQLPMPGGYLLLAESEQQLRTRMKEQSESFVRAYSVNNPFLGKQIATNLWIGNYDREHQSFEELAEVAKKHGAIKRIGVLRADVDNLGQAFVNGFDSKFNTLSRTATFSRHLSIFFQHYINSILQNGKYMLSDEQENARNAVIVYSGGDDVFLVGAWDEVVAIAVDLKNELKKYTQGTLTLSAGIGVYSPSYPISRIAVEVGKQEEQAKDRPGKSAISILPDGENHPEYDEEEMSHTIQDCVYSWEVFEQQVLEGKYKLIKDFFESDPDKGMSFMYRLLELIRNREDKIYSARFLYLLARMEPKEKESEYKKEMYKKFRNSMHRWYQSKEDCRQLKTAMNMYSYMTRNEGRVE